MNQTPFTIRSNRIERLPHGSYFDFTTSSRDGHILWSGLRLGESHAVRRTSLVRKLFGKMRIQSPK